MPAFLVFNELSSGQMFPSLAGAKKHLEEFSEILVDDRIKGRKSFVAPSYFLQVQVFAGYSIGRLLAESKVDDEAKRLRLKLLVDRRNDYSDCVSSDELDFGEIDYRCSGEAARGLFVAISVDGLAISLLSSNRWNTPSIELEKSWLSDGDLHSRILSVLHASRAAHLGEHGDWVQRQQASVPANGVELWNDKLGLYPNLDFCDCVENQIASFKANEPRFRAIVRGLRDLQNYCESWDTGNFDIFRLGNASGESQSTLNMYSEERTFRCPDGGYRVFQWHLKRGDTRIHFVDFPDQKRILVGYVGAHLRISSQ